MENYVPAEFNKSILDIMIESGAIQFWIAIAIGMMLIGLLVIILESDNKKITKIKDYVRESIEEIFGE